jgi:hypothetical protein
LLYEKFLKAEPQGHYLKKAINDKKYTSLVAEKSEKVNACVIPQAIKQQ